MEKWSRGIGVGAGLGVVMGRVEVWSRGRYRAGGGVGKRRCEAGWRCGVE